jgi:diacylglycerol kinase (ATP)
MRDPNSTEKYKNICESTVGAATGLWRAIRTEHKIRQVFVCLIVAITICKIADVGYFQILIVIFSWVLALICEMFNTALEKALDYTCGMVFHPLIRQGKDYAAACTFVALLFALALTSFVLWDRHINQEGPREKTFQAVTLSDKM